MRQLGTTIDSLEQTNGCLSETSQDPVQCSDTYPEIPGQSLEIQTPGPEKWIPFQQLIPDSAFRCGIENTYSTINNIKSNTDISAVTYENDRKNLRMHLMAWHEKITMSIACLVLFLIGAPLGSIIRKGGIGLPLIFAVIFFVVFFLLNNFGRKFVKQDVMQPISWHVDGNLLCFCRWAFSLLIKPWPIPSFSTKNFIIGC